MPPEGTEAGREPAVGVQTHGQLAAAAAIVGDFFFFFLTFQISEIEMYVVWIASIL